MMLGINNNGLNRLNFIHNLLKPIIINQNNNQIKSNIASTNSPNISFVKRRPMA